MDSKNYLKYFRSTLLSNNEVVGELEYASGNYDNKGNLIAGSIPTITTNVCEVGIYNNTIYFTFIILPSDFKKEFFNSLPKNVQIYPFKDFNNTLYPKQDFDYSEFEQQIKQDKYLQVNFNDNYKGYSIEEIMQKYLRYKDIFVESNIKPINQLEYGNINL